MEQQFPQKLLPSMNNGILNVEGSEEGKIRILKALMLLLYLTRFTQKKGSGLKGSGNWHHFSLHLKTEAILYNIYCISYIDQVSY